MRIGLQLLVALVLNFPHNVFLKACLHQRGFFGACSVLLVKSLGVFLCYGGSVLRRNILTTCDPLTQSDKRVLVAGSQARDLDELHRTSVCVRLLWVFVYLRCFVRGEALVWCACACLGALAALQFFILLCSHVFNCSVIVSGLCCVCSCMTVRVGLCWCVCW